MISASFPTIICRRSKRCSPDPVPTSSPAPFTSRGAEAGDTLQIDILDVKVRQDWGFVSILPLLGTLPDEFTDYETIHPAIDRAAQCLHHAVGHRNPARSVLRHHRDRAAAGLGPLRLTGAARVRRQHGQQGTAGRHDVISACLQRGALFFAGDGHAVQGDGEVCITALETGVTGTFRLTFARTWTSNGPLPKAPRI